MRDTSEYQVRPRLRRTLAALGVMLLALVSAVPVAGFDPATGRLVLVVVNHKSTARNVGYDLSHFNLPSTTRSRHARRATTRQTR
jgi:hypothetical protein